MRAQAGVLGAEGVPQIAALGVDHPRGIQINTQFGTTPAHRVLDAEQSQIDDPARQEPPGRQQDPVIGGLRQHDVATGDSGPFQQPILEHLRGGHGRRRHPDPLGQLSAVDVFCDQGERGVDLAH